MNATATATAPADDETPARPPLTGRAVAEQLCRVAVQATDPAQAKLEWARMQQRIVVALGERRRSYDLATLEAALLEAGTVSEAQLREAITAVSGLRTVGPGCAVTAQIPEAVARAHQIVAVAADVPTVAFVEDSHAARTAAAGVVGPGFDMVAATTATMDALQAVAYRGATPESDCPDIFTVFDAAATHGASDVHLSVGTRPTLRIHGQLRPLPYQPLSGQWIEEQMTVVAGRARVQTALSETDVDLAYRYGTSRYRINLGMDRSGLTVAARKLPTTIPDPQQIGLPKAVMDAVHLERGMVIVTGPTGSGKSSTLASLLNTINLQQPRHIITLEDPIEFVLPKGRATVHQRELGDSFQGFAQGLRQALRQDPDIVLVGELRDLETMRTALTAAETGHLVLATLHTYDAASTVARLVTSFPEGEQAQVRAQLAHILKLVVSQTLVPAANGQGRHAAFEVMVNIPPIAANLRKLDGHVGLKASIESGRSDGMQTMDMSLAELVRAGLVTQAEAEFRARDVDDLRRRILHGN